MGLSEFDPAARERVPWNDGRKVGAKRALKPRQIWAIRFFLDRHGRVRDRALFDLAIDSKLRGCDLMKIRMPGSVKKRRSPGAKPSAGQDPSRSVICAGLRHGSLERSVPRKAKAPRWLCLVATAKQWTCISPRRSPAQLNQQPGRTRLSRRAHARSGRMAHVRQTRHSGQHHPPTAVAQMSRTQSGRKRVAVHAR